MADPVQTVEAAATSVWAKAYAYVVAHKVPFIAGAVFGFLVGKIV